MRIGAICSGAYVLAMASLLDGKPCALYRDYRDAFVEDFPDVIMRHSVFVADLPRHDFLRGPRPRT